MSLDARVPVASLLSAFGVPAVVTRPAPDSAPITTEGIWHEAPLETPGGSDVGVRRREIRRHLTLSTDVVPTVPRGSLIDAPLRVGGSVFRWKVDSLAAMDSELLTVSVVLVDQGS